MPSRGQCLLSGDPLGSSCPGAGRQGGASFVGKQLSEEAATDAEVGGSLGQPPRVPHAT